MRIVRGYHAPVTCLNIRSSFPVFSVFTGRIKHHCIDVFRLPCGRTFWVVPYIGYVGSLPFVPDILDLCGDGVFYNLDELYNSLAKGGFLYRLDMSKSDFYSFFGGLKHHD